VALPNKVQIFSQRYPLSKEKVLGWRVRPSKASDARSKKGRLYSSKSDQFTKIMGREEIRPNKQHIALYM
jgi:hypothetical protein